MQAIAMRLTRFSLAFVLLSYAPAADCKVQDGDDASSWRAQGFQQSLRGEKDDALISYQHAVDTALKEYGADSSYVGDLYYEMGALALDAKKPHTAEVYLQKAVQQNPNSIMARVKYSEALQLIGKRDEGLTQIQAALTKHQNSPEAREALVLWWQNKAKEDGITEQAKNVYQFRAIQESSILGQILRLAAPVAAPKPIPKQTVLATTAAPPTTIAVNAAPKPMKAEGFWARMIPRLKPAEPPKEKPPAAPPQAKAPGKPKAEVKKAEPRPEPKAKKGKKTKPENVAKPATAPAQPVPAEAKTALVTSAKQLPKAKTETVKRTDTDEIQAPDQPPPKKEEPKKEEKPKPVAQPPAQQAYIPVDIFKSRGKPRKTGLVPPPPPMTPIFPGSVPFYQPPPQAVQPKPEPAKPKPKPKEAPKEESKNSGSEDPDFILEWAGKKKK